MDLARMAGLSGRRGKDTLRGRGANVRLGNAHFALNARPRSLAQPPPAAVGRVALGAEAIARSSSPEGRACAQDGSQVVVRHKGERAGSCRVRGRPAICRGLGTCVPHPPSTALAPDVRRAWRRVLRLAPQSWCGHVQEGRACAPQVISRRKSRSDSQQLSGGRWASMAWA